jgi:hypothetical protein
MSFNSRLVFAGGVTGATTAYTSPLASYKGSQIALNTVVAGTTTSTAGLVLAFGSNDIEWDSLAALVETDITTNTITVSSKWQGSGDGTNWVDIVNLNGVAKLQIAAAGTGSLITTQYFHPLAGVNPFTRYIRLAVVNAVATGGAGDNVTVSYCFRRRSPTVA